MDGIMLCEPEPKPENPGEQLAAVLSSATDLGATAAMLEHLVCAMRAPAAPSAADHLQRAAAALENAPDEAVLLFAPQVRNM
jgi:hypothetical protein